MSQIIHDIPVGMIVAALRKLAIKRAAAADWRDEADVVRIVYADGTVEDTPSKVADHDDEDDAAAALEADGTVDFHVDEELGQRLATVSNFDLCVTVARRM